MHPTFNLIDEAWIPCVEAEGHLSERGLQDVLAQAHVMRELAGESPLVTAALYRLLLAVVHRVFGPAGYDAWYDMWEAGQFDASQLAAYMDAWRHHFDLFDAAHPFYQAADDRVKPKPVNSLVLDLAFGNKATLFDHSLDAERICLTPGEAARAVIAAQAFGLAGLSGLPQKFTDGTCARGVMFLIQGETLFETLMLNLLRYPTEDDVLPHSPEDRPAWEMEDPYSPERSRPHGYLDYLTWHSRRVLLLPEEATTGIAISQMTLAPGLRLAGEVLDPMKHYRVDEKRGYLVQRFNEDRALWRDSSALFKLRDRGYRPPRTFYWLSELIEEGGSDVRKSQARRYLALGMANNQAKVDFYRSESCPLPLRYLTDESLVERLDEALKMAEDVRNQLWGAARTLAALTLSPQSDSEAGRKPAREDLDRLTDQWAVERDYWSGLELPFRRMMEDLPKDVEGVLANWRERLRQTAWAALERVAGDLERDTRNLKATVQAREQLAAGLGKVLPRDQGGSR
jgi:CRISPR system Cascade subunit CasA